MDAYGRLVNSAQNLSQNPLQTYAGSMVAGFTPQQQSGFQTIDNSQGIGVPYTNAATQEFGQATTPLWPTLPQFNTSGMPGTAQAAYGSASGAVGGAQGIANALPGMVSPYAGGATAPINVPGYDTLSTYTNPYTKAVTEATQNLFNQQNATRASQISGDAASQHALGGDREAVAQALATQQENTAQAPVLAGIQQSGFQQAQQELNQQQALALQRQQAERQLSLGAGQLTSSAGLGAGQLGLGAGQGYAGIGQGQFGEFNTQQQQQLAAEQANAWLASQAAFGLGGLGTQAQTQALTGAQAQLGAGGLQQQLAQEQLNIPYQQFLQTQAYPYQQLQFLAPIIEGTGSLAGGTGSTTSPGPSTLSQLGGLGLAGLGGLGATGAFGSNGWLTGGNGSSGGVVPGDFWTSLGDWSALPQKRGGRIGFASGGMTEPDVPGIGHDVPTIDLSYIPTGTGAGIPSKAGISPFQPVVNTTNSSQSSGSGGGILGLIGPALSIGKFFLAEGGAVPRGTYDDGGAVGIGATPRSQGTLGLPPIPPINLDYIVHPGPVVKGSGPPKPPAPAPEQNPIKDSLGMLGTMKNIKGMFGGDSTSSESGTANQGGRIGSAIGGAPMGMGASSGMGGAPIGAAINFGGEPPNIEQSYQQMMQLPLDRLQQLAVQYPPNSQQGQLVARALAAKKMTPGAGTAPVAPPSSPPAMGGGQGLGLPVGGGTGTGSANSPQDYSGTSHLAVGGTPGYVTPDELDPHPIVDHSGDTVKIRYPSEGKVLDLGLPPIRDHLADGGRTRFPAGGSVPLPHLDPGLTTAPGIDAGTGTFQAPNGIFLPQMTTTTSPHGSLFQGNSPAGFGSKDYQPGGGLGNWFQPLAQYHAPGYGIGAGPGGSTRFPASVAFTPAESAIISGLNPNGATIPPWAGGAIPAASTPSTGGTIDAGGGTTVTVDPTTMPVDTFAGSDKRGGRIGFADGGDIDPREYIEPPPVGYRRPSPPPPIPDPPTPEKKEPHSFADGGDTDEFGMEDYVPAESGFRRGVVAHADLPPIESDIVAHADIPPSIPEPPPRKGIVAHADLEPPPPSGIVAHADIPAAPQDKGAHAEIPPIPPPAELRATPGSQPTPAISSDTADILAEHEKVDRPGFYSRARSFESLPTAPPVSDASPYSYGLAPEARAFPAVQNDVSDVVEQPNGGLSLPPARAVAAHADIPPASSIGAVTPRTGGLGTPTTNDVSGVTEQSFGGLTLPPSGMMLTPDRVPPTIPATPPPTTRPTVNLAPPPAPEDSLRRRYDAGVAKFRQTEANAGDRYAPNKAGPETFEEWKERTGQTAPAAPSAGPEVGAAPVGPAAGRPTLTPQSGTLRAGLPATQTPTIAVNPPTGGDPATLVKHYESEGLARQLGISPYVIGWGGTDLSNAPKDASGFPIWEGKMGPAGNSRAAGAYQFEPATWKKYAEPLGIHDFSPESQDAVFRAAYLDQGYAPWAPFNSQLAAAIKGGAGVPSGAADRIAGKGEALTPANVANPPAADPATTHAVANAVLEHTPPAHRGAMAEWMNSPWFPVFLAGAGMLASRSPFPGVALGEGLLTAGKGMETVAGLQNKAELAEARLGTLQANADAKLQHADYLNRSLEQRTANQTATQQLHEAVAASQASAREANLQYKEAQFGLATIKVQMGEFNPPQYVERPDPTDPTKKVGGMWYSPKLPDPNKPDGGGMFIAGAGGTKPVTVTGNEIGIQDLIHSGAAKDRLDAEAQIAAAKRDPHSAQAQATFGHLVQSKENEMLSAWKVANQMNLNAKPPNFRAQAEAAVRGTLGQAPGPATPATAAPATPAAPAAASAQPAAAPVMPTWAKQQAIGPAGQRIFSDGAGWFNADHTPYAPSP